METRLPFFAKSALAFALCTLAGLSASAQILDRLERRAKQRANQRVEKKIDEKVDKAVDSAFDATENAAKGDRNNKSDADARSGRLSGALMSGAGMTEGADVDAEYSFHHAIDMQFENFNRKGKKTDVMEITMMLSKERPVAAMNTHVEGHPGTVVIDSEKKLMFTLADTEGQKMGIAFGFDGMDDSESDDEEVVFTPTGETKTISGYRCKAYRMENAGDDKTVNTVWMTEDAKLNWMEIYARMSEEQSGGRASMPSDYPSGTMIMMESVSERSGERSVTTVREIRMDDKNTLTTEGYRFITMGGKR